MAITSDHFMEKLAIDITHTARDNPKIVDTTKLVGIAHLLHDLVLRLVL